MRALVVDVGSSNVKIYVAHLDEEKEEKELDMWEADRFPTGRPYLLGHICTDIFYIYDRICRVIKELSGQGIQIDSIGIDSWCSDYGIVDVDSGTVSMPVFYRDGRTDGYTEKVSGVMDYSEVYRLTTQRKIQDSTLCQLLAYRKEYPKGLEGNKKILFIGDLLMYLFTGVICSEVSAASYSQLFDIRKEEWQRPMFERFHIPADIAPPVVRAGTKVGRVKDGLAHFLGVKELSVVTPAVHDTASAGVAVPAKNGENWAFLATGSWFLMSMELEAPADIDKSYRYQLSNTGTAFGRVLLKKNITAMWLVQECRRQWERMGLHYEYEELKEMAGIAEGFKGMLDTEDESFYHPENMVDAVCSYLEKTGQNVPDRNDAGQIVRIIYESIALQSARALAMLEDTTGRKTEVLYVIGGANRAELLNQFLADACAVEVRTGSSEASAVGNALLQAYGMGRAASLDEMRRIAGKTCRSRVYRPGDAERTRRWRERYGEYTEFLESGR